MRMLMLLSIAVASRAAVATRRVRQAPEEAAREEVMLYRTRVARAVAVQLTLEPTVLVGLARRIHVRTAAHVARESVATRAIARERGTREPNSSCQDFSLWGSCPTKAD